LTDLSIVTIIPLYNGARWIEGAIESVFAQTLQSNEFIIVDDGSTDEGPAIVEKLARQRSITLLRKPNGGQSSARNFGVQHSSSALIAFLDQDDVWYPNHLDALRDKFVRHKGLQLGWVYSDFDDINEDGKVINRGFLANGSWEQPKRRLNSLLLQGVIIQPSAALISRAAFDAVGGFDEKLCGYEDDDLFLRIFQQSFDNVYIPFPTSQWRIHSSSCGGSERMDNSLKYYIKKLLAAFPDDPWRGDYYVRDLIAPRFITTWLQMYVRASRYKNYSKMREYAGEALALVPLLGTGRRKIRYLLGLPLLRFPRLGMTMMVLRRILNQ
jgi:glycosyltransferase involved in cell wall biosynthesis